MVTKLQQKLLDAGYKKYVDDDFKRFRSTSTLFQKCIKDNGGKKYYIDVWWYDLENISLDGKSEDITAQVQFSLKDGDVMDVTSCSRDINRFEEQFEEIWVKVECDYRDKIDN